MNKIIRADFNGQTMQFTAEAWFNATAATEKYGKRPVDWLNQDGTREYIATLSDMLKCEPGSLLKTKRGNNGGTWLHPKLAVRFAQWLDVRFAIWCDMQIDSLSKTDLRLLELLEAQDMVLLGRGMAYDERKQALRTFAQEQRQRLAIPANDATGRLSA